MLLDQQLQRGFQTGWIIGAGDPELISAYPVGHEILRPSDMPDDPAASHIIVKFAGNQIGSGIILCIMDADQDIAGQHIVEGGLLRNISDKMYVVIINVPVCRQNTALHPEMCVLFRSAETDSCNYFLKPKRKGFL